MIQMKLCDLISFTTDTLILKQQLLKIKIKQRSHESGKKIICI